MTTLLTADTRTRTPPNEVMLLPSGVALCWPSLSMQMMPSLSART